ncbi:hypothetical protein B296_00019687, partial [Ensete ventricosum]
VLLLCGPPGLGKTTLSHIAAKHCGYCVLEVWALINASDDRSASMIESKILDVVQMNSVMPDSKPKCLIIDEIDGALGEGKGAVDVILKMVCIFLVICICNDVYAPALRALRQVAKVHMFMQPTVSRVVNRLFTHDRLKFICEREGLRTNRSALSALAEYTVHITKYCFSQLELGSQVVGRKDITRSVIDVWKEVNCLLFSL